MYCYDAYDRAFVAARVAEFDDQVSRRLSGALTEDEFKILRLMNGVYLQLHAYMLRIAIPYGTLSADQLRALAGIARRYDRGYCHFTTRQNLQLNWIALTDMPAALADLADAGLHAMQTSGNCIRNVTSDPFAGVAPDEVEDPRPYAEILRQWSTIHPEFTYLPRKFKIAITGATEDRAAIRVHDIGLILKHDGDGKPVFEVLVGGGLGRTPYIAVSIRDGLPAAELLAYLESILRVYNAAGRRDNIYKARIKILVAEMGREAFAAAVEADYAASFRPELLLSEALIADIRARFVYPTYPAQTVAPANVAALRTASPPFAAWLENAVAPHKIAGYAAVKISLKRPGQSPGDATAEQLERLADLADGYSFGEIRVTHGQNLVFPHVARVNLPALWRALDRLGLATANHGLVGDIIACPGLDYCDLANARSIPVARAIAARFAEPGLAAEIGRLQLNISGCINACAHHHVGHIGILGVDKDGVEFYQILLGGRSDNAARLGRLLGPALPADRIVDGVASVVDAYRQHRLSAAEPFIDTVERLGLEPFKEAVYDAA